MVDLTRWISTFTHANTLVFNTVHTPCAPLHSRQNGCDLQPSRLSALCGRRSCHLPAEEEGGGGEGRTKARLVRVSGLACLLEVLQYRHWQSQAGGVRRSVLNILDFSYFLSAFWQILWLWYKLWSNILCHSGYFLRGSRLAHPNASSCQTKKPDLPEIQYLTILAGHT